MKTFSKVMATFAVMALMVPMFAVSMPKMAQAQVDVWGENDVGSNDYVATETGLGQRDPREIAAAIIKVMLGFLGIIAVVIILLGGFKWMTAAGNEDKIDEAKKLIMAGVIGLVIILASYGIANFVLNAMLEATNGV